MRVLQVFGGTCVIHELLPVQCPATEGATALLGSQLFAEHTACRSVFKLFLPFFASIDTTPVFLWAPPHKMEFSFSLS